MEFIFVCDQTSEAKCLAVNNTFFTLLCSWLVEVVQWHKNQLTPSRNVEYPHSMVY